MGILSHYRLNTILVFIIVSITSLVSSLILFNYLSDYNALVNQYSMYKDFDIILVNPADHIKEQIKINEYTIIYNKTYEKINDTYLEIISSNSDGIAIGLPSYSNSELLMTHISNTQSLKSNVIYSNHPSISNLNNDDITYPREVFINISLNSVVSFLIDENINDGFIYFIKDDPQLKNYLIDIRKWGGMTTDTYVGSGEILATTMMNNYKPVTIIYGILSVLPIIFSSILLSILIRYLIDKRNDEIVIRHIFYTKKTKIILQFLGEFLIVCLPGSILAIIFSSILMRVSFNYALMMISVTLLIFVILYIYLLNKNFRKISKTKNIGLLMRKDKSWLD